MPNYSLIAPAQQWVDANGNPASGYRLFTYSNRTATKKTTTTTADASVSNPNPITLDSNGRCANGVFGSTGAYTLLLAPPGADDPPLSTTWSRDDVSGINDVSAAAIDQWIASGFTPTFISATSFSVAGDQTSTLTAGRRVKTTNSGGTVYSTIISSSFGAGITTVVVSNDSGTIDSGILSVSYGVLSAADDSVPRRGRISAMTLLQAPTVVSGSPSTVDFTIGFDGTFDQIMISITGFLPSTNGANLLGRISLDGTTYRNTAADYVHVRSYMDTSTLITSAGSAGDTQITLLGAVNNTAGTGADGQIWIANMASSTVKKNIRADFTYFSTGVLAKQASSGCFVATNGALLGFRFLLSAGNFSAGTFAIYGLRKA